MKLSDKDIINGCIDNDRKCQELLYRQHFAKMMSMCMRYASDENEAMTILNDGFLRVFKKIHTFQYRGSFEGWIRRLVFNSLSDHFKKKSKQLKFIELGDWEKPTESGPMDKLYEADILQLIEKVPNASADVFILYAIHGYAHKEIAEIQGISIGTSKWHLSNAKKVLQELIKKQQLNYNHG